MEPEGQLILKEKILNETKIPVIIPDYGEEFELDEKVHRLGKKKEADEFEKKYIRLEVLDRILTLKEELEDMSDIVKEEMLHEDAKDEEIEELNKKIKELEQQIVKIIE